LRELGVDVAPPDPLLRARLPHDELVLRRPAGVAPGVDDDRTAFGELAVPARERMHVEQRGRGLVDHASGRLDPVLGKIVTVADVGRDRYRKPPSGSEPARSTPGSLE